MRDLSFTEEFPSCITDARKAFAQMSERQRLAFMIGQINQITDPSAVLDLPRLAGLAMDVHNRLLREQDVAERAAK